ncbi:uncharacterized protein LOC115455559 isoform X2 [Manduca sexta]|uniref:uncharacterized protein LOC115455559 isoform X2 n=1 Tax=Manduca sexta TaxID=7130 RepID=UPI001182E935|nr:uncharacterized protein LOC115455559 isoform X2 [Manduca sexta]
MQTIIFVLLAATLAVALEGGQYYVPRAYYTIDAEGHESAPVPLRRLRRSLNPYPYSHSGSASANANANAEARGWGEANANANANAHAVSGGWGSGHGGWGIPSGEYGSANPNLLRH